VIVPSSARISAVACPRRSRLDIRRPGRPEMAMMAMPLRKKIIRA
jgi:hypothetical protein